MHRRTALGLLAAILTQSATPAAAWCLFSCDPTESHGRSAFEGSLQRIVGNVPFKVTHFEKTNGKKHSMAGFEIYEMSYQAVVEFPSGISPGRSRQNAWNQLGGIGSGFEMQTRLAEKGFRIIKGNKVDEFTVMESRSSLAFEKTERGWQGEDGRVYKP